MNWRLGQRLADSFLCGSHFETGALFSRPLRETGHPLNLVDRQVGRGGERRARVRGDDLKNARVARGCGADLRRDAAVIRTGDRSYRRTILQRVPRRFPKNFIYIGNRNSDRQNCLSEFPR